MSYCDDLVVVHARSGTGNRGYRTEETSIDRAIVVLAIAAWQVAIENLVLTGLDLAVAASSHIPGANMNALKGTVDNAVKRFSTANSTNSRTLLLNVGFDPSSTWSSFTMPGPTSGRSASDQLDDWLKLRHAIAHGNSPLPGVQALQHVRQQTAGGGPVPVDPRLRLVDAKSCMKFVRRLTKVTADAFADHLGISRVAWTRS